MKQIIIFLTFLISFNSYSQDLPTEPANGFAFPIGCKFKIKMYQVDSINFNYSIIEFEPFQKTIDIYENDTLFNKTSEEGTIQFYFCYGTTRETEKEREKNMKVLLIMKNYTNYSFSYFSKFNKKKKVSLQKLQTLEHFQVQKVLKCGHI